MRIDKRWVASVLVVVAAALVVSGCTPSRREQRPRLKPAPMDETLDEPGLYRLTEDQTLALGTLQYRDLEGGFWAVVDAMKEDATPRSKVLAVIVNAESLGVDLSRADGAYVAAEGRLKDGVSIRIAGPELEADSLKILSPAPSDTDTGSVTPTSSPSPTTPR